VDRAVVSETGSAADQIQLQPPWCRTFYRRASTPRREIGRAEEVHVKIRVSMEIDRPVADVWRWYAVEHDDPA